MRSLEGVREIVFAVDHVGRRGEQLEVLRPEVRRLIGVGQGLVGVQPRPSLVGLATSLEVARARIDPDGRQLDRAMDVAAEWIRHTAGS